MPLAYARLAPLSSICDVGADTGLASSHGRPRHSAEHRSSAAYERRRRRPRPGTHDKATRPSGAAAERLIQIAKQLPDAPSTGRCRGVAAEHVDDDWRRAPASLINVTRTHTSIIARHKFCRSRRVGRSSQNVLHLMGVGQWMQVRGGRRAHRGSRRIARGRGACGRVGVSGRPERRPRGVAQCLPAFAASGERPRGVDRVARAGVGRVCSLEDLQHFLRALSSVPGDLTKVLYAQNDLAGFLRHGCILARDMGRRHSAPVHEPNGHIVVRHFANGSQTAHSPACRARAAGAATGPRIAGDQHEDNDMQTDGRAMRCPIPREYGR